MHLKILAIFAESVLSSLFNLRRFFRWALGSRGGTCPKCPPLDTRLYLIEMEMLVSFVRIINNSENNLERTTFEKILGHIYL